MPEHVILALECAITFWDWAIMRLPRLVDVGMVPPHLSGISESFSTDFAFVTFHDLLIVSLQVMSAKESAEDKRQKKHDRYLRAALLFNAFSHFGHGHRGRGALLVL